LPSLVRLQTLVARRLYRLPFTLQRLLFPIPYSLCSSYEQAPTNKLARHGFRLYNFCSGSKNKEEKCDDF
jgi:hypothetical protein